MRLHIVSDVHGATDALRTAADGADAFLCLGDLILFVDYHDFSRGIFADLFGTENCRRFVELRTRREYAQARAFGDALWNERTDDRRATLDAAVRRQYAELFDAMPRPAFLTYGNVDIPSLWPEFVHADHTVLDGSTAEVGGLRIGMVGGGLVSPMRTPFEISPEEYGRKLAALGDVDVLCVHIPPALPGTTYDVVARRFEIGSRAVVDYIDRVQPRFVLHGHVHQPLRSRTRRGRTEVVNVGHFASTGQPYVLEV